MRHTSVVSRIIAGKLASRRVATPAGETTRPTTDRVRESVFAHIASRLGVVDRDPAEQLAGCTFLDLYAGSGAVGLEAASRGARVTWVENHAGAARVIRKNLDTLKVTGTVRIMDVARYLSTTPVLFDLVWMDPPYTVATEEVEGVLTLLDEKGWVGQQGIVMVERAGRTSAIEFPESFLNVGQRRYGDTIVYSAEKGRT